MVSRRDALKALGAGSAALVAEMMSALAQAQVSGRLEKIAAHPSAAGQGVKHTQLFEHALADMPGHQFVALRSDLDPGASMSPHTHPGSMIGYVFHGSLQVQVAGAKLSTYQRGEWWYVEPAQIIRVTSNTSKAVRASMLAFLLLPKGKPVSTPVGKKA